MSLFFSLSFWEEKTFLMEIWFFPLLKKRGKNYFSHIFPAPLGISFLQEAKLEGENEGSKLFSLWQFKTNVERNFFSRGEASKFIKYIECTSIKIFPFPSYSP
jgi:hypothetical protein